MGHTQMQIPYGNDNKKSNGNKKSKDNSKSKKQSDSASSRA
jgi:hypothetical protein